VTVAVNPGPSTVLLLTVDQVMKMTNLSKSTIQRAIARGDLRVVRIGRAVRVPSAALSEWLERLEAGADA